MKTGRSLSELALELERQENTKRDFVLDTRKVHMTEDAKGMVIDGIENAEMIEGMDTPLDVPFGITNNAHSQIGQRLNIPKRYYDLMKEEQPELLAHNVNHWFEKKPQKRMIRTLDGNARAYMSERYRCLDNFDLAKVALHSVAGMKAQVKSCEVTDSRLYLQIVTPRIEQQVKVNDIVQAGFIVSNSEIGMGSLKVEPLVYRLACLNGMVINDAAMRKYHVGRSIADLGNDAQEILRDGTRKKMDEAFWMTVRDIIENAVSEEGFMRLTRKMVESTEVQIKSEPIDVVERVKEKFHMTDREGNLVLKNLYQGNDMSQWGLMNAVTALQHDTEMAYDRSVEVARMGGEVLELSKTDWSKIDATAA